MSLLNALIETLAALFGFRQTVRAHKKREAYGPGWSKHRLRRINAHKRRRAR